MVNTISCSEKYDEIKQDKKLRRDFHGGPAVKNPLANAGDTGSILGMSRLHMPWGNKAHNHSYWASAL